VLAVHESAEALEGLGGPRGGSISRTWCSTHGNAHRLFLERGAQRDAARIAVWLAWGNARARRGGPGLVARVPLLRDCDRWMK
jgi:hypothetical protein